MLAMAAQSLQAARWLILSVVVVDQAVVVDAVSLWSP